jgi:hypothetical protein
MQQVKYDDNVFGLSFAKRWQGRSSTLLLLSDTSCLLHAMLYMLQIVIFLLLLLIYFWQEFIA